MDRLVFESLADLGMDYTIVEHPPALTTEEADRYIEGLEGVRTKSMFLTNKKKTAYYLLIMDDNKQLDMDRFRDLVGANRIRMASSDSLKQKMHLPAGVVSIFGLLHNGDKDVQVYFDKEILTEPILTFHPNVNTKTIFVKTEDILRFVEELGFSATIVDLG
ncbi:TPA: prolyl-tRNA synthetase associated domain-containing protein [Streptococcus suis]|uniref:prolyl-tRNA synthetase associated domain-containing protein n=1 Tax=Streptococcus suis TaxID=1307 RepID=UPI00209ABB72|nr:prolyl-tRNA synthetase associated domain-containing protein [Streptococcus suis]MCO8199777.1 prolyl-tRNA synthetase associated domain-containing protein [Streptococcus suis]MCO8217315.1 prolyl-tRNA synthetase associated domain-containing protein [Streptococcus suis]HEM3467098.1 prolyl-tRNA synthetase associated domain-containing protein [Streptococcus suis]HEM3477809.1 prolyl-tRNA synthetase associated domain-containing protein [Streptococcus suis]HEM3662924.1 prolyl-tRNA synthetase associa